MNKALYPTIMSLLGLSTIAVLIPVVRAQSDMLPWISRPRVVRTFDVESSTAVTALEKTITEFFDTEESRAAFTAAFEANLFPPKTGEARVRALEEIQDRIERELGPDSPALVSITAEKETVEAAVREEEARRKEALQELPPAQPEK